MRLNELIQVCNGEEIAELLGFWQSDLANETEESARGEALIDHMTDEVTVRRRLRFLSRKLVEVLRFFLGRRQFEASLENVRRAQSFSLMSPHEVEAAARALMKRGFLFPTNRTQARPNRFVVPKELGDVLRMELDDLDLELSDAFALRRVLGHGDSRAKKEELARLCEYEQVAQRRTELADEAAAIFDRALEQGAGLLSRARIVRDAGTSNGHIEQNGHASPFARRDVKEALERAHLGTVRHLALGEYGINHFDDMVIVFEEVLWSEIEHRRPHPEKDPDLRVRALGVDLLSDLADFLGRLSREKVRLTQSGSIYRTAARKIEDRLILASKGDFDADEILELLFDLALKRHLVRRTTDRQLALTAKGRMWPRLGVEFKLKELMGGVLDDPVQHFHRPRLQEQTLEFLKSIHRDRWYDFPLLVGYVRHRYLSTLDENGIRAAYQSRYQYSSDAHMRGLTQLTQIIGEFLARELHLLGLIDLALSGDRPVALRLTPLAAKVFGATPDEEEPESQGPRLLVNPDFEVVLFPDGDCYELIQQLDGFAERVSAEGAYRWRITARSVERAVARGMTVAGVLETLSEHSDAELPQNVVFSVRDHAEKVRFVRIQRAILVSARHKEVIDSVLKHSDVRRAVLERLSPRMLALNPEAPLHEIVPLLEADGVFLEGVAHTGEEGEDAPAAAEDEPSPLDEPPDDA